MMRSATQVPGSFTPVLSLLLGVALAWSAPSAQLAAEPAQYPLFMGADITAPPLTMIVMGRDHTLYYEAYNDASDLNGDGVLDVGYKPDLVDSDGKPIDYFGYFDSYLCYDYDSSDGRFAPNGFTGDNSDRDTAEAARDKTCTSGWSGDFLNYLTTARIDALRKVLYGGHRIIDEGSEGDACLASDEDDDYCLTVLERSYIPQDAHSWGKEYKSIDHDGYDIRDYTPLNLPASGSRHLFANTTLLDDDADDPPLLRVLNDSQFRIWEWVAIENPVAGSDCDNGSRQTCAHDSGTISGSHPGDAQEFLELITQWGTDEQECETGNIAGGVINGSGNPFSDQSGCSDEYYLTVIEGTLDIPPADSGVYQFATNGDDAVEVYIDGELVAYWYDGHGAKSGTAQEIVDAIDADEHSHLIGTVQLDAGLHNLVFHHEEISGSDSYQLLWKLDGGSWETVPATHLRGPSGEIGTSPQITTYSMQRQVPASAIDDKIVRVEVCSDPDHLDAVCKTYPGGPSKPVGLLQQYGEGDEMYFGLLTGSYTDPYNTRGGMLRRNIGSFAEEIDAQTGRFNDTIGIAKTIDLLRVVDFGRSDYYYADHETREPLSDSSKEYPDWGNPIGEMVYETLRYFSGKEDPTSAFVPTDIASDLSAGTDSSETVPVQDPPNADIVLPAPAWRDPYYTYDTDGNKSEEPSDLYCSPGAQLIISDVNPSYDTDQVPGSAFDTFASDMTGLDAATEADAIWAAEHGGTSTHFIGQSGDDYDGAPTAKTVTGLGNIRGLSPAEPTKEGGYYTAGVARYGFENDLRNDVEDIQDINTFAVALASPLPRIEIPVGEGRVTVVPFAKSVKWEDNDRIDPAEGRFQPTNTIVDFFIEEFANTSKDGSDADLALNDGRPYIKFRINYEDVEQGADHDMDAIVDYELKVDEHGDLVVTLDSEYAAGGIVQHIGYVISGTEDDGVYLEVRDVDTEEHKDPDYFLDTPSGVSPGGCAGGSPHENCDDGPLPLSASRTFTPSAGADAATVLESPLWYAAKYGSEGNEDLETGETSPNYFLVTNAGTLQEQLETAFESIILLGKSSASAIAVDSVRIDTETLAFQAQFDSEDWSGTLIASPVEADGTLGAEVWSTDSVGLPDPANRNIFTYAPNAANDEPAGIAFTFDSLNDAQKSALGADTTEQEDVLGWLRGDQSREGPEDTDFRIREKLLGDIVNSNPFYDENTNTLYVGANDGMLHAFRADDSEDAGEERFAYVPNALFPTLANLTDQAYSHRYYVDGSPSVADLGERVILVGTLAAGGRALFALDVTTPDSFAAEDVLWEISNADSDFTELGYMIGQMTPTPVIGNWNGQDVVVFGNGVDSGVGATLFVVNAETGALVDKLTVSTDTDNGLAGATLVLASDGGIAAAYAGDLKGNLWKFDFTGSTLELAANGNPLFVAESYDDDADEWVRQPITAPVNIAKHPDGGNIVAFGTGQYVDATDPADLSVQTAYGIWDNARLRDDGTGLAWHHGTAVPARSTIESNNHLLQQRFWHEEEINDRSWRVVSNETIDWGTKRGWYVDLISPANGEQGERVNYQPSIIPGSGEVMFTSIVPTQADDPCQAGTAERWIFVLDVRSGGISDWTRFDTNEDGVFDEEDVLVHTEDENAEPEFVPYIGFKTDFGGSATPAGRDTDVVILDERLMPGGPPRQSWRQLR